MAHNDYVREDGQWPPESVPTARDWALFDRYQSKGLNLAGGNVWTPSTPIIIGGAGLVLGSGAWVRGSVRTESGGRLVLGDDDYVQVTPPRAHTVLVPFVRGVQISADLASCLEYSLDPVGLRIVSVPSGTPQIYLPIPAEAMHDGATLASATVRFRVGQEHAQVPSPQIPGFYIARFALGHASSAALSSNPVLIAQFGLHPVPTTADAYYAGGAVQAMSIDCDQNNVIDVSSYSYLAVFADEYGTGSLPGNVYHSLELHFTNITDLRPE